MKIGELIEKLQAMPPDAEVLFDTEAARFNVHMVSVDSAFYEEEPRPHCGLHTKDPREYTGATDRMIANLRGQFIEGLQSTNSAIRLWCVDMLGEMPATEESLVALRSRLDDKIGAVASAARDAIEESIELARR